MTFKTMARRMRKTAKIFGVIINQQKMAYKIIEDT